MANTTARTLDDVAARLAAPVLTPRIPLLYPLPEGAVQNVLADAPGVFVEVADQPITAQALASASHQLGARPNPEPTAASALVGEVLRIHRTATGAQSDRYFLPHEAYPAARANLHRLGEVIVFLPCEADPIRAEFLAHLQQTAITVDVDGTAPTGTMVIHASDADDEVRAVTRLVRTEPAAAAAARYRDHAAP